MYLGIKSGPDDWQSKLDNNLDIQHVEIYFNLDWLAMYDPLWAWLQERGSPPGCIPRRGWQRASHPISSPRIQICTMPRSTS